MAIMLFIGFSNLLNGQALPEQVAKIGDNIYSYGGYGEYYSMFIVTSNGVIVIESVDSRHATEMVEAIKEVTNQPIKYLLHSHNHWDHASGGQVFKDAGAKTIAHIEAYEWMKANTGRDMAVPDESWGGNRKDITLGETTIELHYLGMNHGLGMTVFLIPEQKIAYVADLVTPNRVLMSVVPDFNIKEWERSIEELIKMDFDKAVYSHNESLNALEGGDKQDAKDNLQLIKDIRAGIYAEFEKGTNPYKIPTILKLPKYQDWVMYDEWLAMNIWRVLLDEFMGPFPWRPDHEYQGR
jgi:glyoxylase-like metal-dependent hydrolase (beta-lactamase superfamily II)